MRDNDTLGQDLLRCIHAYLPLDRIEMPPEEINRKITHMHDSGSNYSFASKNRVAALNDFLNDACFICNDDDPDSADAVQGVIAFLSPRCLPYETLPSEARSSRTQHFSQSLMWKNFFITPAEIEATAHQAVALSHVRLRTLQAAVQMSRETQRQHNAAVASGSAD